jgi:putative ABC transport system ATP-binding protein
VIELHDIRKRYRRGDRQVLAVRVDRLVVERGEQLALVGRSGCGKTTLLNIVAGIVTPDSGTVEVDGVVVNRLSQGARDRFRAERMGYVFQTFNLLQSFTALENVELGQVFAHGRRDGRKRALDLLDRVGLADRAGHFPRELSVGQQQRVAIARALVNDPKILLADEPLGNLDQATGLAALEILQQMAREAGRTILMVTHDPETAAKLDRTAILELPVEEAVAS